MGSTDGDGTSGPRSTAPVGAPAAGAPGAEALAPGAPAGAARTGEPRLAFPRNPAYGSGATRRRVVLEVEATRVLGWLGDTFHEMACEIEIAAERVGAARGRMIRFPTTSCPGAIRRLDDLRGCELGDLPGRYYRATAGNRQCTHLYDLAVLAVLHAGGPPGRYDYGAVVPDETDAAVHVEATAGDERAIAWRVRDGVILDEGPHRGAPLRAGFVRWAERAFTGRQLAAALVLARTYLVALGRAYDSEAWAGRATSLNTPQRGRCYAYTGAELESGRFRAGYTREFSAGVEPSVEVPSMEAGVDAAEAESAGGTAGREPADGTLGIEPDARPAATSPGDRRRE